MEMKEANVITKWTLIVGCELFLALFLILPLVFIIETAFAQGLAAYWNSITDQYAVKAAWLTVKATLWAVGVNTLFGLCAAWCITKFAFRGKKIISTFIDLPVTVSPIIAGLIYVLLSVVKVSYSHCWISTILKSSLQRRA